MCKSMRNQFVETVEEMLMGVLVDDVPPFPGVDVEKYQHEQVNEKLGDGGGFVRHYECKDGDGGNLDVCIQGGSPVMSLVLRTVVNGEKVIVHGDSRLKNGDEWDAYTGYKICSTRAARMLAGVMFKGVDRLYKECYGCK